MRRKWLLQEIAMMLFAILPFIFSTQVRGEEAEKDEWTVLFYFCGSDLESKYSFATGNLEEIASVIYPDSYLPAVYKQYGIEEETEKLTKLGKVNVLIETGGSKEWHAQDIGMDIRTDALQRWRYRCVSNDEIGEEKNGFELLDTLPLESMADPETLTDFIRWGAETCPAKKYALVLWDHGGGAKTGLFIDEMFKGDVMYLFELKQSLADSGVHLNTLIIDACMMANLETAWAVSDSADYLVASEEVVPGKGTAIDRWLQILYGYPTCDGRWLGRSVCDMTSIKYGNEADDLGRSLLTWSVIDLTKLDPLIEAARELFQMFGETIRKMPSMIIAYSTYIDKADEFGDGRQNMHDLGRVINERETIGSIDAGLRAKILKALSDVIDYSVRGSGRAEAMGLSFCYPADFSEEELEIYAKNFPMSPYLAYIDAISSWSAPDWVYDEVEKLPEISEIEELDLEIYKEMCGDGMPAIAIPEWNNNACYYRLYQLDEKTDQVVRLGRTMCGTETADDESGKLIWRATDPMHWPAVEGQLCCIDLVQHKTQGRLYDIPVQIDSEPVLFRCGRKIEYSPEGERIQNDYEIFGVWQGYDDDSDLLNRSVTPIPLLAGQEYKLLYPIDDGSMEDKDFYAAGTTQTISRHLHVEEIPLPAGTYYLEYEVKDMFLRSILLDRIEIHWDGEHMTFPEGFTWEGVVTSHHENGQAEQTEQAE